MGAHHTKDHTQSSQTEIHHHDPMSSQILLNSNLLNTTSNLSNQMSYLFNSENDLNDTSKSMKQQMKIASIGANKATKNKLKTSSNQNINAIIDPNELLHQNNMQISFDNKNFANSSEQSYSMDDLMRSSLLSSRNQKDLQQLYIALYDFDSRGDNQLSIKKGEIVRVIDFNPNGEWCEVQSNVNGLIGWVPSAYITMLHSLEKFNWYHGAINRNLAEFLLSSGINGSFLIRESESSPGQRSISLRYDGRVYHYRINEDSQGKVYVTAECKFDSLAELVDHHTKHSDGLITQLIFPAPKRSNDKTDLTSSFHYSEFDEWEIDRTEIVMKHKLGSGQYGDVYSALYKKLNLQVAVKTLKQETMALKDFLEEAGLMKEMKHPNLVKLLGVCTREPPFFIITEFMSNGNLLDFLRNCNRNDVHPIILMYMATQISYGMEYLEGKRFIHRDLAARNCLVGDNHTIKICDFGLARLVRDDNTYTAKAGAKFPIKWTSPEGLAFNKFSTKSDVWSYGVLLWELATYGMSPYPGVELISVFQMLESGYRMECPVGCPSKVYTLMLDCWQWDPRDRPTFKQIRERLESMFNNTDLNEEVERELGTENLSAEFLDLDEQRDIANNTNSFQSFNSPNLYCRQVNEKQQSWNSINLNNSTAGGLISTKSTVVPLKPLKRNNNGNKQQSAKSSGNYVQHQLVSKLKTAPIPPKRTSSFRDSSFQPDPESIRNSLKLSNLTNSSSNSCSNSTASTKQPEDEEILEGARETMNGLEKVFESLSDNFVGSNTNEIEAKDKNNGSIENLKNVLNKQKLPNQKLKPSKKGLKLSKNSKNTSPFSKKETNEEIIEKTNKFSSVLQEDVSRNKVQVANLLESDGVKKAINRYGTLSKKGANINYLNSLHATNDLTMNYQEQENDLNGNDYPTILQTSDSLLTSPDFVPVDYNNSSIKPQINSSNHLATVSRKLAKGKIIKSVDDSVFNPSSFSNQCTTFLLNSPEQRKNNSFKTTTFNNLTRQKSDLTHLRTNHENSLDDQESEFKGLIGGSNFFLSKNKLSQKKSSNGSSKLNSKNLNIDGSNLPSTSSSASSSNSNTMNRDFNLGQNKENLDALSVSLSKQLNQSNGNLPLPPARFQSNRMDKTLNVSDSQNPPHQIFKNSKSKTIKCNSVLDKNVSQKPESPVSKYQSQLKGEEEGFYVRSDQLDQLHSQLNDRLSLNKDSNNGNTLFYNENHNSIQQLNELNNSQNNKLSFLENFKFKSRKKSTDNLDCSSPQLTPKNELNNKKKTSTSNKHGLDNRKLCKSGPQIPAPKVPTPRQAAFSSSSSNQNTTVNSSIAEYVTPVLNSVLKKTNDRNHQSNESSESENSNSNNIRKEKSFVFGQFEKKSKTNQIKTRNKDNETKLSKDDEKRQSISSITSLKKIWEPARNHQTRSSESLKCQKSLPNESDQSNVRESPSFNNEFLMKSKSFINNNKMRKDQKENDDLSEQTHQYKKQIIQSSNLIERIFDEISINDHNQLKDLLLKVDQLRKSFQSFSDLGFIALQQRFKYQEFLKKFETQAEELNQYYEDNVNIKLVMWNKLCLALKLSLKELVSIVENQK